ncbi:MAG: caspase family protein [Campylobacterota bacterium]|nr:caspase family protein [Campylobacterota bacterium]
MKIIKLLLSILLLTLHIEAGDDRSIYRKKHGDENRVALVIGNSDYDHFTTLKNPVNDAEDMQRILKAKGFDVLYLKNGDLRSMKKIVRKFAHKLRKGGVGFFYYAGHGMELEGQNYLVPTKADIPDSTEVEFETLPVKMIINKMEKSHNRLNIIVLDACRNNPLGRGGAGGLAAINNAKGMYIAFATAPGEIASDGGAGRNGLFTKHLIKNIDQNNLKLNDVFKKTRASVHKESNYHQLPWTSSSVIGDFYFQSEQRSKGNKPISTPLVSSGMSDTDRAELVHLRLRERQQIERNREELARLREFEKKTQLRDIEERQLRKQKLQKDLFTFKENGIDIHLTYPSVIGAGQKFSIHARMTNSNSRAKQGGLTLSFPDIRSMRVKVLENNFSRIDGYSYPQKIYNKQARKALQAKYFMIEGWQSKRWSYGRAKSFSVELVAPRDLNTLKVNVRGVLWIKNRDDLREIPTNSFLYDQQGFAIKQFTIKIK